jgi:hypothetical protein
MRENPDLTTDAVEAPPRVIIAPIAPEFIRLPKPGTLSPHTGLSRSALNDLILPTPRNGHKPPVRSFVLRQRGARTGIRLIDYRSLADYIRRHEDNAGKDAA